MYTEDVPRSDDSDAGSSGADEGRHLCTGAIASPAASPLAAAIRQQVFDSRKDSARLAGDGVCWSGRPQVADASPFGEQTINCDALAHLQLLAIAHSSMPPAGCALRCLFAGSIS